MRYRLPQIAMQVEKGRMVYRSPDEKELAEWLENTLCLHEDEEADTIFATATRPTNVKLHVFPATSQMMLHSPHTHIDARGICTFWNSFFMMLSTIESSDQPRFGKESDHLPVPDDRLYTLNEDPGPTLQSRAKEAAEAFASDSPIGIPSLDLAAAPTTNRGAVIKISKAVTESIIQACKAQKISVTAAWHAANAVSAQLVSASSGGLFCPLSNFDMRQYTTTPHATYDYTVLMASNTFPFPVMDPASKPFIAVAKELHQRYRSTYSGDGDVSLIKAYYSAMGTVRAKGPPKVVNTAPILSSIGIVENFLRRKYEGGWTIDGFWIAETLVKPWPLSMIWTFDGQMVLSASFNAAHFAEDTMDAFLQGVKNEMLKGLGIQE